MLEENKECKSCGFDTMPIVTVETKKWEYCPECGSRLVSVKDDIEDNVDEEDVKMKSIPINGENNGNKQSNDNSTSTEKDESESSQRVDGSDDSDREPDTESTEDTDNKDLEEELDELEDKKFVEDELDRLRSRFGSDSDDDED